MDDIGINDNARMVIVHDLETRVKKEIESIAFSEEKLARKNEEIDKLKTDLSAAMASRNEIEKEIGISRANIDDFRQALEALKGEKKNEDQNGVRE